MGLSYVQIPCTLLVMESSTTLSDYVKSLGLKPIKVEWDGVPGWAEAPVGQKERDGMPQVTEKSLTGAEIPVWLDPSKLKSAQADYDIDTDKVLSIVENAPYSLEKPIIISKDNFVIDGHHRALASIILKTPVLALVKDSTAEDAIVEFREKEAAQMIEEPKTGPRAMLQALKNIDLDALEERAKADIASGKKTKRRQAVQVLNAIAGLKRNQTKPEELMINRIPIIPAKFRPFAVAGQVLLPNDANVLYKDMFDIKNAYMEEKELLGEEESGDTRLALFDTANALYGYGDPIKQKTKQQDIRGFLKQLAGRSAKSSFYQSKMMGKPMDGTGRSVVIVDPELGLDELGVPRKMAMRMYSPFVQRRLTQQGFSPLDAVKHIKDETPEAMRALEEEIEERGIMTSRDPAWYRFNFLYLKPKLIDGDAIASNPLITTGLNSDFDGNCIIGSSKLLVKFVSYNTIRKLGSSEKYSYDTLEDTRVTQGSVTTGLNTDFDSVLPKICVDNMPKDSNNDCVMKITKNTRVLCKSENATVCEMAIADFPIVEGTARKDKNGALVYDVPTGVQVLTTFPDGKGTRWADVATFTVEDGCSLKKVTTRKKSVVVSDNESLAVFDAELGLKKIKPVDAIVRTAEGVVEAKHACPIATTIPSIGDEKDYKFGWLLGAFLSDGTYDGSMVTYTKQESALRTMFLDCLAHVTGKTDLEKLVKVYKQTHEAATNAGIGGESIKIHINNSSLTPEVKDLFLDCYGDNRDEAHRSCIAKKIPSILWTLSRDAQLGLLAGLLDGDGTISVNRSKKNPQVIVLFSTSSPALRDDVMYLCRLLGITTNYTTTSPSKNRKQRVDNYTITISTKGVAMYSRQLKMANDYEGLEILKQGVNNSTIDLVPLSYSVFEALDSTGTAWRELYCGSLASYQSMKCKVNNSIGYALCAREWAQTLLEVVMHTIPSFQENKKLMTCINAAFDETTNWEYVSEVEDAPAERVYDLCVPETKVFALASGLVIYDTYSLHVPVLPETIQEGKDLLMPSANPFSSREADKIVPLPKQEHIWGPFNAITEPAKQTVVVKNKQEALSKLQRGEISMSDNIEFES